MILVIDNYDSFTYNLVQYLGELGSEVRVVRNDAASIDSISALQPARIVISPGPGRPEHAGITMDVIRQLGSSIPILGVCLGHQAIGAVFGGAVVRASTPMHGKTSTIEHDGRGVFAGIDGPFRGVAIPLAGRLGRGIAGRARGYSPDTRGPHNHGAAASRAADPWRAVSS